MIFLTLVFSLGVSAQQGPLIKTDILSAKTMLENLIIHRYSHELATRVHQDHFSVSAQLEVKKISKKQQPEPEQPPFTDLDLGFLDAEQLLESYSVKKEQVVNFLDNFAISKVSVSIGLDNKLESSLKEKIKDWVRARVTAEFGANGIADVYAIQTPPKQKPEILPTPAPLTAFEQLKDYQNLAGQIVMALALLAGVLLWRLLSTSPTTQSNDTSLNINNKFEDERSNVTVPVTADTAKSTEEEYEKISQQVLEITPKVMTDLEKLIGEWINEGQKGIFQLACFAEVSGTVVGRLPIPDSVKNRVSEEFAKMHSVDLSEKTNALKKAYWDLVTALNLGSETLHQPFSFLGNARVETVNEVLLSRNPRMRAVVSQFMPNDLRKDYFTTLNTDQKIEMLSTASSLDTIDSLEVIQMEQQLASSFDKSTDSNMLAASDTVIKMLEVMKQIDVISLVTKIDSPAMTDVKHKYPSLAFLEDWKDSSLSKLLEKVSTEEIISYLRLRPDLSDRFFNLVSPMTKQILIDDFKINDRTSNAEKELLLQAFAGKLNSHIKKGKLNLLSVFRSVDGADESAA